MVCGVSQLADVKVNVDISGVPSLVSLLVTVKTTSALGWACKTTVNVSVPPASVVLSEVALNVKPAVSSSALVAFTPFALAKM
jgi:hypothetical protein